MNEFDDYNDFKVKYKFRTFEQGGRRTPAHQGLRCDFWYHNKENKSNQLFMIWPAFEDEKGKLIESGPVNTEGYARMKIVNEELTDYHKSKIIVGVTGYFMEGLRKIADCVVVSIGERLK